MTPPPTNGLLGGDVISDLLDAFVGQTSKPKELNQPASEGLKSGANLPAGKRDLASYLDGEEDTKIVRAQVYPDIFAQNEVDKGGSNSFRARLAEDTFFDSEFLDNDLSGEDWFGSTGADGADGSDGWICNGDYLDPTLDPRCYGDGFDHKLPSLDESVNDSPCNSSGNQDISPIASPNTQARRSRKKRGNENFYRIKAVELQRAIRIGSSIPYMYHPTPYFLMPRYDDFMPQAVYPLPKDRGCIHIGDKRQYRSAGNTGRWGGITCDYEN